MGGMGTGTMSAQGIRQLSYPAAIPMDDANVEWRRDIYRVLRLTDKENSGLLSAPYQEREATGLFAAILSIAMDGKAPLYRYNIDGTERLTKDNILPVTEFLDDFQVSYKEEHGRIYVNSNDMPWENITIFYVKEAVYYDMTNSSYHTVPTALCPVMEAEDDIEGQMIRYPLFWVRYAEIEPWVRHVMITPETSNSALVMSVSDYFTLNMYKGQIYRHGNEIIMTTDSTDSTTAAAMMEKIEKELATVRHRTYNTYYGKEKKKYVSRKRRGMTKRQSRRHKTKR